MVTIGHTMNEHIRFGIIPIESIPKELAEALCSGSGVELHAKWSWRCFCRVEGNSRTADDIFRDGATARACRR